MQIYRILNNVNGKSYIGSTESSFEERYPQGKWWKWTHSLHLKSAVEKYGLENFEKIILWEGETSPEDLIKKEKESITEYKTMIPNGYNLIFGGKKSKPPTHVKTYEIVRHDGEKITVKNLSKFCRDNKLNYGAMLNMVCGINKSSQGFALKGADISKIKPLENEIKLENVFSGEKVSFKRDSIEFFEFLERAEIRRSTLNKILVKQCISKSGWKNLDFDLSIEDYNGPKHKVTLYHEDGRIIKVDNIYKFCKDNNLHRSGLYSLASGEALIFKGWSLNPNMQDLKKDYIKRFGKKINLISPSGEKTIVKNISEFCREQKFILGRFYSWLRKQQKESFDGWTIDKDVNIEKQ